MMCFDHRCRWDPERLERHGSAVLKRVSGLHLGWARERISGSSGEKKDTAA
jgi:hypothetical protein